MANEFHRLNPPPSGGAYVRAAWSGVIPQAGVLDWINNDPSNPSSQAPADGALANPVNPYKGTYFIGGMEDAADIYANRAHRALAEGLDQLDNALHRAIPFIGMVAWTVTAPTDTFTFPSATPVYMGGADQFVRLVSASDMGEVMSSVGTAIHVVQNTHDPLDAANFATNTVLQFSDQVPVGDYYVLYGAKNCVAEVPELFTSGLYGYTQIPAKIERLLQILHAPIGGPTPESWDAPWDSTIYDLSLSGLNERYRRATVSDYVTGAGNDYGTVSAIDMGWPQPSELDKFGAGAWILRRGLAPTVFSKRSVATPLETDKLNACLRAVLFDDSDTHGGSIGVAVQGARPMFGDNHQLGPGFATVLSHRPVLMSTSQWYVNDSFTVIPLRASATVRYELVGTVTELVCELTGANTRFSKTDGGVTSSAIATGYDMLEITDSSGAIRPKFWLIHKLLNDTKCVLRQLNGDIAPVGVSNGGYPAAPTVTNVGATWHTIFHSISDGAAERQLQLAVDSNAGYDPGEVTLPSPGNYGTVFMASAPWLGVRSSYLSNQYQQFDQSVVSIFGSVLGDPVGNTLHPDVALQVGAKHTAVDTFGQTAPAPYFTVLSNGITYATKLNVGELDAYDKQSYTEGITVNTNMSINLGYTLLTESIAAPPKGIHGIKLYPYSGNTDRYAQIDQEAIIYTLAHDNTSLPACYIGFAGAPKALYVNGGLGYQFRRTLPRGNVIYVYLDSIETVVDLYLDSADVIYVAGVSAADDTLTLRVRLHKEASAIDQLGAIFTCFFHINCGISNIPAKTVQVQFESGDHSTLRVYGEGGTIVQFAHSLQPLNNIYEASYFDIYFGAVTGGMRNVSIVQKTKFAQRH